MRPTTLAQVAEHAAQGDSFGKRAPEALLTLCER